MSGSIGVPERETQEQQQVVTLWTVGATPVAGGPLIVLAGSAGGLVLPVL